MRFFNSESDKNLGRGQPIGENKKDFALSHGHIDVTNVSNANIINQTTTNRRYLKPTYGKMRNFR